MKNSILAGLALVIALSACNKQSDSVVQTQSADSAVVQSREPLKNLVSIVEIPVTDLPRAIKFYESVLGVTIEQMDMGGVMMGILPSEEGTINVVLAKGEDYKPTTTGATLYLSAGEDLQPMLDKVTQNGGQVIVPKTEISAEMGFFALFTDTEGNKLGLHSPK